MIVPGTHIYIPDLVPVGGGGGRIASERNEEESWHSPMRSRSSLMNSKRR